MAAVELSAPEAQSNFLQIVSVCTAAVGVARAKRTEFSTCRYAFQLLRRHSKLLRTFIYVKFETLLNFYVNLL